MAHIVDSLALPDREETDHAVLSHADATKWKTWPGSR
uniref:Uncharacterized protein n=1 Tax=Anguilla anguilla TaxID=7936 RepID=A0A0E9TJ21_ANGAN